MVQKTYYKTKDYCKVKFSFTTANADSIEIRGLNNDWNSSLIMKKKKDGAFVADINLPKNTEHQFRYVVNHSEWLNDPESDKEIPNEYGESNSMIVL